MRRRLAEAYRWVLVDELHDVNPVQARLVEALAAEGGHLIAVADPDQSIYSWRGADPEVVERFAAAARHARLPAPDELPLDPRGRRAGAGDAPGRQPLRQAPARRSGRRRARPR